MRWFVFAHPGQPIAPHDLWMAWNFEPAVLLLLEATLLIYLIGLRNVWRQAGRGRGMDLRQAVSFIGAWATLFIALISPLDALSGALFSAHMAQHLLLSLVAAPLFVLSNFPVAFFWALPRRWAQSIGQHRNRLRLLASAWHLISSPVSAWLLFAVSFWGWHAPLFYEAALRSEAIHILEHFILLATASLFWWVLFKQTGPAHIRYGAALPYLFTTALHNTILGALMTFTSRPWYSYYTTSVLAWGLTPLQDQQLAGLIMWLPGGAVFTLLTIGYFAAWLHALEQRNPRLPWQSAG